ncbi:TIGR03885 family FMN-dependent LLM class oxidoreductase [Pelagerythrobacter rhizovicinus]|uniref:TIGR03885 family FMN-dependent LLM class oxidoreductase n=1 Tax=Pelagerythrobacter rhizovicinus TaxID=2268576 RepID=A0A4Q2KJL2_9SPHN|nr:TIGR03885 family FMN-dependent LLM class oxidoreductase [Pelagerythrobacter rhizovicinus]RXZ65415.1 TIGR03885 family FMN-dependent LLM class oxidoreductase [Pelagerythrobacter rhizovicinus]
MLIGYHASHEQFAPEDLRVLAREAERAGFGAVMSSDHFKPWSELQGQSGFAWVWLGAAMEATSVPFGTLAVPGGWRYHPAIVAQAGATLARLFPGRLAWLGLGSGEALNESVVGQGWPPKAERNSRLEEGARIIRALWNGETVSSERPIPVREAHLYTRPAQPHPLLVGAALGPETAQWLGAWADGLITVNMPREQLGEVVAAFRRGGGAGKRLILQMHLSWAPTEGEARDLAWRNWRFNVVEPQVAENCASPEDFEEATRDLGPEDLEGHVIMASEPEHFVSAIVEAADLGFDEIYLHNVGDNQRAFLATFGEEVLPRLPQNPCDNLREPTNV